MRWADQPKSPYRFHLIRTRPNGFSLDPNSWRLNPYTALLNASEDGSIDPPVVPIHSAGGSSTFSPSGARYDYPELRVSAQLPCLLPRSTELG